MRIKLNSVGDVQKEKNYFFIPINFTDEKGTKDRKAMSFNKAEYEAFKAAKAGDEFNVGLKKGDDGYWKWDTVSPASAGNATANRSGGSNSDGGVDRQKSIVRQSSLAQAVATLGEGAPTLDVLMRAEAYEEWVNRE